MITFYILGYDEFIYCSVWFNVIRLIHDYTVTQLIKLYMYCNLIYTKKNRNDDYENGADKKIVGP